MGSRLPKHLIFLPLLLIALTIKGLGQLQVSFQSDTLFACANEAFQVVPSVTGGFPPYSYNWSTGDTSSLLNILPASDTVDYHLLVSDAAGKSNLATITVIGLPECVWPGDANGSARADNLDLLTLGRTYNTKGEERPNAHLNWTGQAAPSWTHSLPGGANYAHSDVDGNGYVDGSDQPGIEHNYLVPQDFGLSPVNNQSLSQPLYLNMPSGNFGAGDTVQIQVMLGNSVNPAQNVYGLAFSLDYDPAVVDSASISVDFNSSWLATPQNRLTLVKNFYDVGQLDVAITRTNKINVNGFGRVADITVMIDDITGKKSGILNYQFDLKNITLTDALGQPVAVTTQPSTLSVVLGNEPAIDNEGIALYPNPVQDHLNLELDPTLGIEQLFLRDLNGNILLERVISYNQSSLGITLEELPEGIYLLELSGRERAYWHKIHKRN